MNFREFLTETNVHGVITKDRLFVMIIGGVASGKSYVYSKYFSSLPLIDIDEYTKKWSNGDYEKARKLVSKGIKAVESDLKAMFITGQSVVNTGSGAGKAGVLNKLKWAKENDYKTCIVLVDVPLETALKRNQERADKGDRNLIPDYKVQRTNKEARENFKVFKKEYDYSLVIKN